MHVEKLSVKSQFLFYDNCNYHLPSHSSVLNCNCNCRIIMYRTTSNIVEWLFYKYMKRRFKNQLIRHIVVLGYWYLWFFVLPLTHSVLQLFCPDANLKFERISAFNKFWEISVKSMDELYVWHQCMLLSDKCLLVEQVEQFIFILCALYCVVKSYYNYY